MMHGESPYGNWRIWPQTSWSLPGYPSRSWRSFNFFVVGYLSMRTRKAKRSGGALIAFLVALFAEMYGFALPNYLPGHLLDIEVRSITSAATFWEISSPGSVPERLVHCDARQQHLDRYRHLCPIGRHQPPIQATRSTSIPSAASEPTDRPKTARLTSTAQALPQAHGRLGPELRPSKAQSGPAFSKPSPE